MSRRSSDKTRDRITVALVVLAALSSVLSSVIGYKALVAIEKFDKLVSIIIAAAESKNSLLPEGY